MSQTSAEVSGERARKSKQAPKDDLPPANDALLFRKLFGLSLLQRAQLAKRGIPARWFVEVSGRMAMPKEKLYRTIGVAKATITRKSRADDRLDINESERALAIMVLLGQVDAMVSESGTADDFDAPAWTASWLDSPQPALGGRCPGEWMDTADGRALVSGLLARMQSGAYM